MNKPVKILFAQIGGTWDMVKEYGKLVTSGNLDDEGLFKLEESLGFYKSGKKNLDDLELSLSKAIEKSITSSSKQEDDVIKRLSWVPSISKHIKGKFISLFSGESSHLRPSIIAPLVTFLLKKANSDPLTQIIGAQGTDTADMAILPLLDAYAFDTELPPFIFTGANRAHIEWNSDAPKNFADLVQMAGSNLPSGAYWVFASNIYKASDLVKIDPLETRRVEHYSTFLSPRLTARHTKKVVEENDMFYSLSTTSAPKNHISQKVTTKGLYDAMTRIHIVDLGSQNNISSEIEKILDKDTKAIIVAGHSLGNVDNPIKDACIKAAIADKIVVSVSRSLIGEVNGKYDSSLLAANEKELIGKGKIIISGHKMNKNVAKAIVTRALQENLDDKQTQALVNEYCESRGLM